MGEWEKDPKRRRTTDDDLGDVLPADERSTATTDATNAEHFRAHVVVPDQADIKKELLARKKANMLARLGLGRPAGAAGAPKTG